jgi:hypothetical protein
LEPSENERSGGDTGNVTALVRSNNHLDIEPRQLHRDLRLGVVDPSLQLQPISPTSAGPSP